MPPLRIGVLALQGGVAEHMDMLRSVGARPVAVRRSDALTGVDGLVLPGGESTALIKLIHRWSLADAIVSLAESGAPLWGTCAGAVLLSSRISEREHRVDQPSLGLAPVHAIRNRFGRQVESFQEPLEVAGMEEPFPGVFIRAPLLEPLEDSVEVLASVREGAVFLRAGRIWLSSFHPELTSDSRLHRLFCEEVRDAAE
ncbi:MAG: pyridoxal 5'-phosphate synthase glutaminase subunit PdxT [Candidatus Fermentibacteraceae bacterium]